MKLLAFVRGKPIIAVVVCLILIIGAIAFSLTSTVGIGSRNNAVPPAPRYFLDDSNGQLLAVSTPFVSPVEHQGRLLYEAVVVSCNAAEKKAAYVIKYSDSKKALFDSYAGRHADIPAEQLDDVISHTFYRAVPATSPWIAADARESRAVTALPPCPDGSAAKTIYPSLNDASVIYIGVPGR